MEERPDITAGRIVRLVAAAGMLFLVAVAAFLGTAVLSDQSFSAADFRAAAAGDREALEREARRAVEQGALVGLSRAEVARALGAPDRIGRARRLWIWDLGTINEGIGPGDGGALYVQFDSAWATSTSVKVAEAF